MVHLKKYVISTNHLNGRFSVFGMFKTCMNDLNSQERDTCFSAVELPFVSRLISLVDKSVCPKAKRKFLELTPILSFITKDIFYKCLVLNMCVYSRKLLLMVLSIYILIPPKKPKTKNIYIYINPKKLLDSTCISFFKQYFKIWFIFATKSDLVTNNRNIWQKRYLVLEISID